MACSKNTVADFLVEEFETWQKDDKSEALFLLETRSEDDDTVCMLFLLGGEHEFTLHCPPGYPNSNDGVFYAEPPPTMSSWGAALNEFLLEGNAIRLSSILDKATELFDLIKKHISPEQSDTEEEEEDMGMISDTDDSAFTTEWELSIARKKKRWMEKEAEVREKIKRDKGQESSSSGAIQATGQQTMAAGQIFTTGAACGILTNDLIHILETGETLGIEADPKDDNIYQWSVRLFNFEAGSELAKELDQIKEKFGYNYIELELDFAIDLHPFYPPLVRVIRPRLQHGLMQRVTNMELLKLSFWNPTKDMKDVLLKIKEFLQSWARLAVDSGRNDAKLYPQGSYVTIEHHLLRLALVSEVNPRANIKYYMEVEKPPDVTFRSQNKEPKKVEFWAAGTGFGHRHRKEWDVKAYLAAQQEKDKQVETVLYKIHKKLKELYAEHAPALKPRRKCKDADDAGVDPVLDVYGIIEGSALIPFMEQYLRADSFLEICRHTTVYKMIVDIIREIARQPQLVPLLCSLPDQKMSICQLLEILEAKARMILQHMCRAGNGSVPKPPKSKKQKQKHKQQQLQQPSVLDFENLIEMDIDMDIDSNGHGMVCNSVSGIETSDERLAREFVSIFQDVSEAIKKCGNPVKEAASEKMETEPSEDIFKQEENLENTYRKILHGRQFDNSDIAIEGATSHHHYANDFKKNPNPSQSQVLRIAQELTSLSTALPLGLSSSIFVRTDEERLTLMRALITGPEGTPYSCGCYLFDIYFPSTYPKSPPLCNLQTTGEGTVRFNPNLYNCGKVCLSLLGTWEGQKGEQWNESTSSVLQVLVSIQSLILVPEPYFNEPGYETDIGTENGKKCSDEYNLEVKINNIKHAIIAQLQKPSPGFGDVIKTHFYLKKDRLLAECNQWVESNKSSKLERAVHNLKSELLKLQAPENLENLKHQVVHEPKKST